MGTTLILVLFWLLIAVLAFGMIFDGDDLPMDRYYNRRPVRREHRHDRW